MVPRLTHLVAAMMKKGGHEVVIRIVHILAPKVRGYPHGGRYQTNLESDKLCISRFGGSSSWGIFTAPHTSSQCLLMLDPSSGGCRNSAVLFANAMQALADVPHCRERHEAVEAILGVLLAREAIERRMLESAVLNDQGPAAMDALLEVCVCGEKGTQMWCALSCWTGG